MIDANKPTEEVEQEVVQKSPDAEEMQLDDARRVKVLSPGMLAGFMLAFVISLDDVVITEFVKSAGQDTLPTYMLGQLRRSVTPEINAISTAFLGLSLVLVTIFFFLNRKKS